MHKNNMMLVRNNCLVVCTGKITEAIEDDNNIISAILECDLTFSVTDSNLLYIQDVKDGPHDKYVCNIIEDLHGESPTAKYRVTLKRLVEFHTIIEHLLDTSLWGIPGGYTESDSDNYYYDKETDDYVYRRSCTFCLKSWWQNESEKHESTCPIHQLQLFYKKGKE